MSEPTITPAPASPAPQAPAEPPPVPTPPAPPDPEPLPPGAEHLGDAGKRALDTMKSERNEARAQVVDLTDKLTSETARLTAEKQTEAERADTAEHELLRLRVAFDTAIPAELHEFLTGANEEELRAKAAKLAALNTPATPLRPAPDPSQGARPDGGTPSLDQQIAEAEKAGKTNTSIALKSQKLRELRDQQR